MKCLKVGQHTLPITKVDGQQCLFLEDIKPLVGSRFPRLVSRYCVGIIESQGVEFISLLDTMELFIHGKNQSLVPYLEELKNHLKPSTGEIMDSELEGVRIRKYKNRYCINDILWTMGYKNPRRIAAAYNGREVLGLALDLKAGWSLTFVPKDVATETLKIAYAKA